MVIVMGNILKAITRRRTRTSIILPAINPNAESKLVNFSSSNKDVINPEDR